MSDVVVVVVITTVVFFLLSLFADSSCIFVISSSASCKYCSAPNIAVDSVPFTEVSASLVVLGGIVSSVGGAAEHVTTSAAVLVTSGFSVSTSPLIDVRGSVFSGDLATASANGDVVSVVTGDTGVFEQTPSGGVLGSLTSDVLAAVYGATGMNDVFVVGAFTSTVGAGRARSVKDDLSAGFRCGVSAIFKLMSDVLTSSRGFAVGFAGNTSASTFLGMSYLNVADGTSYRRVDALAAGDVGVVSVLSFGVT